MRFEPKKGCSERAAFFKYKQNSALSDLSPKNDCSVYSTQGPDKKSNRRKPYAPEPFVTTPSVLPHFIVGTGTINT
ncbi:MAG TPA: hypothetical protein VJ896_13130 [Bacteroidales bacterium]|nr:hypothetical protein [Bacteroidales bacterium]